MSGDGARSRAGLPSPHRLRAALRSGQVLASEHDVSDAQAASSWAHLPTNGVFSVVDLSAGAEILVVAGYVVHEDGCYRAGEELAPLVAMSQDEACAELLRRLLDVEAPVWLSAAVATGFAPEFIPNEERETIEKVIPDPERRERLLLQLGQRFDDTENKRTGDLAEEAVKAECMRELAEAEHPELAEKVRRVSEVSDSFGYDITAPRIDASTRRLESKGTRQRGSIVRVVITRNEAETGQLDKDWALVLTRLDSEDRPTILGWMTGDEIKRDLPQDTTGRWLSTTIYIDTAELNPGLPPIERNDPE